MIKSIITAAILFATPVAAQEWQIMGADSEGLLALQVDTINRDNPNNPYAWVLIVHAWPLGDGTDYTINYVEYDCETRDRVRFVTARAYHRGRVSNGVFDNYDWEPVHSGTWGDDALRIVCRRAGINRRAIMNYNEHDIADTYIEKARNGEYR